MVKVQCYKLLNKKTFYAKVKDVVENSIVVEGISLNDENYRGEFHYDVWEEVIIFRQDAVIPLSDLSVGDLVSITLLTDRTGITNIFKIQLLADKKYPPVPNKAGVGVKTNDEDAINSVSGLLTINGLTVFLHTFKTA